MLTVFHRSLLKSIPVEKDWKKKGEKDHVYFILWELETGEKHPSRKEGGEWYVFHRVLLKTYLWMNFSTESFHRLLITYSTKNEEIMLFFLTKPVVSCPNAKKMFSTVYCGKLVEIWALYSDFSKKWVLSEKSRIRGRKNSRINIQLCWKNIQKKGVWKSEKRLWKTCWKPMRKERILI